MDALPQDGMPHPAPDRVLVVDDERNIRSMLRVCLEQAGCEVREAGSAEAALAALASGPVDVVFVDLRLGTGNGLDLVPALLAEDADLDVVVITAYASIDTAMEAVRRGARDYVPKPFTPAQIRAVVERLRERRRLRARVETLEDRLAGVDPDALLETRSAAMQAALSLLRRAAASDAVVLLRGENGTGKSVLARALHRLSPRAEKPFVTVSAPTLSDQLLVSELFGHARGSFTGAVRDAPGKVEAAEGGTLFLDEIGELGPSTQAQLLRFLQEKAFERMGETRTRHADVRIVSATNRELEADVRAGRFREDLLYRLNVVEIRVPPLRERREDILPMARRMLRFFAASLHRPGLDLAPETAPVLEAYPWPGNVRELRNAVERAAIVWPADTLPPAAFPERIAATQAAAPVVGGPFSLDQIEREHILRVMAVAPTLDEAARTLGIDASTLWRKRKKFEGG
ncbi:MAG TPA: sigma-54 dependent transcriptional regulator [Myxococcaceae bacterium]|nr:sigma-54 dependent transcriptional regulator [Myxococcaceae bacterium]